ncbi:MAG: PilT/PilU family type 4a pilus ATPase [Candidatus Sumerlaeia bacterium]|nr:PilT/PilU family type 4a pilus ATPase [Candidatus Sumerlaeia bacterium]
MPPETNPIMQLLAKTVEWDASDLHLQSEFVPYTRIQGNLRPIECRPLHRAELDAFVEQILDDRHRRLYSERGSVDVAYALSKRIRFRVNVYQQRGTTSIAFRLIDNNIKSIAQLHLPPAIEQIANNRRGIILVTGPAGSGKSTTLAAMLDHINQTRADHIVTVEDPIEYMHDNKKSLIEQREIGQDAHDFNIALMHMLRQDPNVILIGEIRDLETVVMSIRAALTGHLVMSTLHTIGAIQTLIRLLQYYQREEREAVRDELSLAMRAVVSQRFVPGKDGQRVPNVEIMVTRGVIPKLLREERYDDIIQAMKTREHGMQTFDQSLVGLYKAGLITMEAGESHADDAGTFKRMATGGFASDDRGSIIAEL